MRKIEDLNVKIFADGADIDAMLKLAENPLIKGFTTNPTLMRKAGVEDYAAFAHKVIAAIPNSPLAFEVFADELDEMEAQALEIASWGKNVNVKIPVTNTKGVSTIPAVKSLSAKGVQVNVTAIFTLDQVRAITDALDVNTPAIISIFAGRIADTGIDPVPMMTEAANIMKARPKAELLWASPREILNIYHAEDSGSHIITVAHDILGKLGLIGKDLDQYSLETVEMFFKDATSVGYTINTSSSRAAE